MNFFKLPEKEKKLIIKSLAQKAKLPEAAVEKDWWVVQTLRIVFGMETSSHMVFKGGTSLSKAWGLIKRFSEDIDLALAQEFFGYHENIPRNRIKKLRRDSAAYVSGEFFKTIQLAFNPTGPKPLQKGLRPRTLYPEFVLLRLIKLP